MAEHKPPSSTGDSETSPAKQHQDFATVDEMSPVVSGEGASAMNPFLLYSIIVVGGAAFLFGFDNAVVSPIAALPAFVEDYQGVNPTTGRMVLTADNQSLVFSLPLVGSVIGALIAPFFQKRFGRKMTLLGAYIFGLGGNFLQIFAPNLAAFVAGRFWANIATGIGMATGPLYLSELAYATIRGRAVSTYNINALLSSVTAALVVFGTRNFSGSNSHLGYQLPLAIQAVPTGLLLPFTLFVPESPHWMVDQGRTADARAILRRIRGYADTLVDDELRLIVLGKEKERSLQAGTKFWHLFNKQNLERTITGGSMFSFNQLSGIILTSTYVTVFVEQVGAGDPYVFTIIANVCILVGTMVAPFTIDRAGRRPTALSGMVVLLVIDVIAGTLAFFATEDNDDISLTLVALGMVFNFFWAASFYSMSNVLPSEIASVPLRHYTMGYTIAWAQTTAVITTFAVPQITTEDGANLGAKAYLIFAACMALIIVFVYFLVPETKNRTFAEIDELYSRNIPKRHWAKAKTSPESKVSTEAKVDTTTALHNEKQDI